VSKTEIDSTYFHVVLNNSLAIMKNKAEVKLLKNMVHGADSLEKLMVAKTVNISPHIVITSFRRCTIA